MSGARTLCNTWPIIMTSTNVDLYSFNSSNPSQPAPRTRGAPNQQNRRVPEQEVTPRQAVDDALRRSDDEIADSEGEDMVEFVHEELHQNREEVTEGTKGNGVQSVGEHEAFCVLRCSEALLPSVSP
ncbi:unnamed protein product [Cyclocybe aegerita]|uniref:Uncharacterized protein n=1 Tax=Cyclocybe aegerita TaxID=1973307 RepID=A0A8S0WWE2_CYCAE|nr:unnamed protein product [Cyclocybe aegerita]